MIRRKITARSISETRIQSGLTRGYVDRAPTQKFRAVALRYNLEREPLATGRLLPKVSPRVRAACVLSPFYVRRQMAGWLVVGILVAVLGTWNLMLLLGG